jgi:hypothetical protein
LVALCRSDVLRSYHNEYVARIHRELLLYANVRYTTAYHCLCSSHHAKSHSMIRLGFARAGVGGAH